MRNLMLFSLTAGLALGLGLIRTATAEDAQKPGTDHNFVVKAVTAGMTEVKLGEIAMQHAARSDVRKFAQKMVDDHTLANTELTSLLTQKNRTMPREMTKQQQEMCDRLAQMQGAAFDREYIKGQVDAHKEALDLFMKESKDGHDADLKAFADKTLPTIKHHLELGQELSGKNKSGTDR